MENLKILVARWRKEGIKLLPPEPQERVVATFAELGVKATEQILYLYAQLGGMERMDNEDWRLWSLDEIRLENKNPSSHGVLFSDYMIECWSFRLKSPQSGEAEVLVDAFSSDMPPRRIARSLEEFFAAYIKDPQGILNS